MKQKLKVVKAVADPKDGRLIFHYRLNGGKAQTYKPAVEIRRRERALGQCENDTREFFANFLKGKLVKGLGHKVDPVTILDGLATERNFLTRDLHLLRLLEIDFRLGSFRKHPTLLGQAVAALLDGEDDLWRLK